MRSTKRLNVSLVGLLVISIISVGLTGCGGGSREPTSPQIVAQQSPQQTTPAQPSPPVTITPEPQPVQTTPQKPASQPQTISKDSPPPQPAAKPSSGSGVTVYITKTGSKYHVSSCSSLAKSKIAISLADAKAKGFEACKNCKPPQ